MCDELTDKQINGQTDNLEIIFISQPAQEGDIKMILIAQISVTKNADIKYGQSDRQIKNYTVSYHNPFLITCQQKVKNCRNCMQQMHSCKKVCRAHILKISKYKRQINIDATW